MFLPQGEFVVETTLVGVVMNGLSHLYCIQGRAHFAVALIKGLGGNLTESCRENFAKEVYGWVGEMPPDPRKILDTYYDDKSGRLGVYSSQVSVNVCL